MRKWPVTGRFKDVIDEIEIHLKVKANEVKAKSEAALGRRAEVEANQIKVTITAGSNLHLEGKVRASARQSEMQPGLRRV